MCLWRTAPVLAFPKPCTRPFLALAGVRPKLGPWNIPDQRYIDTVVELAHADTLFIFDLGYFKLKAFARLATAGAYFLSRLNHQTTLLSTAAGRWSPVDLAHWLTTVEGQLLERSIFLGEKERVASRLIASRV